MTGRLMQVTDLPCLPSRPLDGHKGTFGTAMIVGGCETMIGAPALAAGAALRAGAGLVKVVAEREVLPFVLSVEPCATGVVRQADARQTVRAMMDADRQDQAVVAVGPGLGQAKGAWELVEALLACAWPLVVDADALTMLAQIRPGGMTSFGAAQMVLTPHPGEFRRLAEPLGIAESPTDAEQRPAAAAALARAFNAVVVLKGRDTIVSDGKRFAVNAFANPAMATAGSGDVLTGLIAGLMAQKCSPWDAAVLGAYLHSVAGAFWLKEVGDSGMTATDLMKNLPRAFQKVRQPAVRD